MRGEQLIEGPWEKPEEDNSPETSDILRQRIAEVLKIAEQRPNDPRMAEIIRIFSGEPEIPAYEDLPEEEQKQGRFGSWDAG